MENHAGLRDLMVERQLAARGITDRLVLSAMSRVPRHLFVGPGEQHRAYDDMALPIEQNQTISQPYMVAVMTELLSLSGTERVLEIGTGSGYQSAVLAELCAEVFSIERHAGLSKQAGRRLANLGYENIHLHVGDGTVGLPGEAPFDRVLVTAACPGIPAPLLEQLAPGGIIVAPVGDRLSQRLLRGIKQADGSIAEGYHTSCIFVPLVGECGWSAESL